MYVPIRRLIRLNVIKRNPQKRKQTTYIIREISYMRRTYYSGEFLFNLSFNKNLVVLSDIHSNLGRKIYCRY